MKHISALFALFSLLLVSGCGGSSSSDDDPNISDGRSVVLRLDQSVSLGDNTRLAVRGIEDNRCPDDAGCLVYVSSVATVSLSDSGGVVPAQFVPIKEQTETYVKSHTTVVGYRITLDKIEPGRGLDANRIKQADFRLTFRVQKVP